MSAVYCPTGPTIPEGFCYDRMLGMVATNVTKLVELTSAEAPLLDDVIGYHWCLMDEQFSKFVTNEALKGGKILFAPKSPEVENLVEYFNTTSAYFKVIFGGIYDTAEAASNYVRDHSNENDPVWAVVQVDAFSTEKFDVSIRLNATAIPSTASVINKNYLGGKETGGNVNYILSGFATLQKMVYDYYITEVLQLDVVEPVVYTPMPTPSFVAHKFLAVGGMLAPLVIVLGFLYPVSQMTKRIVVEKELRIREAMLIMGLSEGIMYLAWALVYMIMYAVVSLITAIVLRFSYLPNTSFGYVFFLFLFFSYSAVALSFAIAGLFSKARLSALLSPLIYFVMAIPLFAMQSVSPSGKTGICLLSPSALSVGIGLLFEHEMQGGAQIAELNSKSDSPTLLIVFIFLFIDILLYLLLTVYFEMVIPKQWGTTKNPLFFIIDPIKAICCRGKREEGEYDDGRAEDGVFEEIKDEESAPVRILGLRKKFKRGGKSFLAVNNLYWSLKQGEISVLLGHNGAGKSTTMNLMTGMLAADKGDCIIYGKSIVKQKRKARQEIGLCPQHNILWPKLTVREHLDYYAALKGLKKETRDRAVEMLLAGVDLKEKEFYRSDALSGGQKRKLSVSVAFVGGSRLIFLDEPTAGMDVGARRHTWGLLKRLSRNHTILLSTHFMDEADLLGNTVAIMSQGRLQCCGSNMFLKSQLGIGFIITMSVIPHVQRPPIENTVRQFVPNAEALSCGAGEMSYRLPMKSKETFPDLLTTIEDKSDDLGIKAYSLSATTLEEIFLQIAEKGLEHEEHDAEVAADGAGAVWNVELIEKRSHLLWSQFRAMMVKRFWNGVRDFRTLFFQIICPVVCVLLAMLLTLIKFWSLPDANAEREYLQQVD
ncbi:ATP-binding protein cassette protein subfamily A, member 9 [Angomonas deanei]|uniref:ABC-2 family transporter protein/ABC transporter, putative n=1 Tax=Angomonas deanei TaxID=59799 RepID=A0A7G2CDE5_9TRYP|nr:ATP-binding protein cassette protein subfamily A, member 9 [Angomonas deanei]CAD2216723.1 ABC-2 family transporter protein/ABC transporter, putative [Angomonas deanei]|eukprot:EPY40756.1 ATP-binding protein cassette protein subfamily A, member 9 [Angomonas deanei]